MENESRTQEDIEVSEDIDAFQESLPYTQRHLSEHLRTSIHERRQLPLMDDGEQLRRLTIISEAPEEMMEETSKPTEESESERRSLKKMKSEERTKRLSIMFKDDDISLDVSHFSRVEMSERRSRETSESSLRKLNRRF